ncbi:MAG: thiopurine S-methyltransferase [Castellaniella sp.]|uniref:thiopurine S-methyltransferase n=1 Tax=Castellaniella sp. TaxID=1955812 RepID=UPI002A35B90D|nr:thiopurine S-methyltransferase [Castellaniella sp.]MDY0308652.1 thiopurine S-methyltransferase [Castellaniella sp.]
MDTDFWLQRWQQGQTGFHQSRVMPLLQKHWPGLGLPAGSRVLVPLAGKSLDVAWLAQQGHAVLAVELSPIAVEQFFKDHGLHPEIQPTPEGTLYRAGPIEFLCGDIFNLTAATLARCTACYDRAALIALTPALRARYAHHVYGQLPAGCRTLLLTLDYPQAEMDGPPFSVPGAEIQALYGSRWHIEPLETRDVLAQEPKFAARGVSRMQTGVFRLTAA